MSRTKKNKGSKSPVKKYLSFSSSVGKVKYYDKEHENADNEGNVYLDSLDFVVFDVKSSISGFNEGESAGISSNILDPYSVNKEEFVVKTKVNGSFGEFARGTYKAIREKVSKIGGKFTTNIFALADVGNGLEIVRLELNGSALSPWIEFTGKLENSDDVYDLNITIGKGQLSTRKKGKTVPVSDAEYKKVLAEIKKDPMYQRPVWFYVPSFTGEELDEDTVNLAVEQDEVLQEYFDTTGNNAGQETTDDSDKPSSTATSPAPAAGTEEEDDSDLPF